MDITKSREESRKQFEYEAGKALCLPTSIIELARKGDGYDHAFDSMNIMHPLNGWWHWWKAGRESISVELPMRLSPCRSGYGYTLIPNDIGEVLEYDNVVEKLHAQGIRIKGESE